MNSGVIRTAIAPDLLGTATISPAGNFEAGSYASLTLTYTAGRYGIDDSGSLRVCFRFASDQSNPQFSDPKAANYTTVEASNGAILDVRFDPEGQCPALGPHAVHQGGARLSARKATEIIDPLRRHRIRLARHAAADLLREDLRIPCAGRPDRDF